MPALALLGWWREGLIGLLLVACALLYARGEHCNAARAADRSAAEQAKSAALEDAQRRSDAIITEQARALAETAARAATIRERIVHVPVSTACSSSPAVRLGLDGVRELRSAGGGAAPAKRGADAPLR